MNFEKQQGCEFCRHFWQHSRKQARPHAVISNNERQSNAMLKALKRWRKHLGLPLLPSPADQSPLLPKMKGSGPIKSANYIRNIVQYCFDQSIDQLDKDGFTEEAEALNEATVHWLRHTGISDDVKHRPREHVRDDAGHSSSQTTDRYIDIELRERHRSARKRLFLIRTRSIIDQRMTLLDRFWGLTPYSTVDRPSILIQGGRYLALISGQITIS